MKNKHVAILCATTLLGCGEDVNIDLTRTSAVTYLRRAVEQFRGAVNRASHEKEGSRQEKLKYEQAMQVRSAANIDMSSKSGVDCLDDLDARGSATLVSSNLLLTAAHVVNLPNNGTSFDVSFEGANQFGVAPGNSISDHIYDPQYNFDNAIEEETVVNRHSSSEENPYLANRLEMLGLDTWAGKNNRSARDAIRGTAALGFWDIEHVGIDDRGVFPWFSSTTSTSSDAANYVMADVALMKVKSRGSTSEVISSTDLQLDSGAFELDNPSMFFDQVELDRQHSITPPEGFDELGAENWSWHLGSSTGSDTRWKSNQMWLVHTNVWGGDSSVLNKTIPLLSYDVHSVSYRPGERVVANNSAGYEYWIPFEPFTGPGSDPHVYEESGPLSYMPKESTTSDSRTCISYKHGLGIITGSSDALNGSSGGSVFSRYWYEPDSLPGQYFRDSSHAAFAVHTGNKGSIVNDNHSYWSVWDGGSQQVIQYGDREDDVASLLGNRDWHTLMTVVPDEAVDMVDRNPWPCTEDELKEGTCEPNVPILTGLPYEGECESEDADGCSRWIPSDIESHCSNGSDCDDYSVPGVYDGLSTGTGTVAVTNLSEVNCPAVMDKESIGSRGLMLGLAGATTGYLEDSSLGRDKYAVGSLYGVCGPFSAVSWTRNWKYIKLWGRRMFRTNQGHDIFDIDNWSSSFKQSKVSLIDFLRQVFEYRTSRQANSTLRETTVPNLYEVESDDLYVDMYPRPASLKMCPPNSFLSGIKYYLVPSSGVIKGINSIGCIGSVKSGNWPEDENGNAIVQWYDLEGDVYDWYGGKFSTSQMIGNPVADQHVLATLQCTSNKAIWRLNFRHNNDNHLDELAFSCVGSP